MKAAASLGNRVRAQVPSSRLCRHLFTSTPLADVALAKSASRSMQTMFISNAEGAPAARIGFLCRTGARQNGPAARLRGGWLDTYPPTPEKRRRRTVITRDPCGPDSRRTRVSHPSLLT